MNYFTKKQLATFAIVLLVIINVSSITTILIRRHRPAEHHLPRKMADNVKATTIFLKKELQFSDAQIDEFIQFQNKFLDESQRMRHEIGDLKRDIYLTLFENVTDTSNNSRRFAEIGKKNVEMEVLLYEYFIQVKNLCTPGQQEVFDVLLGKILAQLDPAHQPPQDKHSRPPHIEDGRPPHPDAPPPPSPPHPGDRRPPPN